MKEIEIKSLTSSSDYYSEMVKLSDLAGQMLVKDRLTMKMVRRFYNRLQQGDFSNVTEAQTSLAYTAGKYSQVRGNFLPLVKGFLNIHGLEKTAEFLKSAMSYHCFYGGDHS